MTASHQDSQTPRHLTTDEATEIDLLLILVSLRSRRASRRNHR